MCSKYLFHFSNFFYFIQIKSPILNLLKSQRLWKHIGALCKAFSNSIFLLRLADHALPAMDKLYYAVRKMDKSLESTKKILDDIETCIDEERGSTVQARMVKYYLSTTGSEVNAACDEIDRSNEDDTNSIDDSDLDEEEQLPDDLEQSDEEGADIRTAPDEDEATEMEMETEGDKIIKFWNNRSKKLRHDLAIAAWMCSPVEKILEDAKENHTGEERDATTSMFKKWFCHNVRYYGSLSVYIYFFFLTFLFYYYFTDER